MGYWNKDQVILLILEQFKLFDSGGAIQIIIKLSAQWRCKSNICFI